MAPRKLTPLRRIVRSGLTVLAMLVVYAFIPIPGRNGPLVVDLVILAGGVAALAYVVVVLARQAMKEDEDSGVGIEALIAVFYAFLVFYSVIYLGIAAQPDEFVGMADRVDSLYFTLTTLSTVGYGDIHAVGTAARIAVTTQLFLDIVLVGLAARLVGPALARSVAARSGRSEVSERRLRRRRGGRPDN